MSYILFDWILDFPSQLSYEKTILLKYLKTGPDHLQFKTELHTS